jgi:hypothetical protein
VGSAAAFTFHKARVEWFHEVRYPSIPDFQDDTRRTVYYRLSNVVFLIEETDGGAKQTMMSSRPRICATMILLSFPFLSAGAATISGACGKCLEKDLQRVQAQQWN